MSSQRIIGIILLAVGAICLVIGMNSSHSVVDQVSETFTGRFTDQTTLYIVGGIVGCIAGLAMLMVGGRGRNA